MEEKIKGTIKIMLDHLSVPDPVVEVINDGVSLNIKIHSQDDRSMVGQEGENFEHFTHLLKRVIAKDAGEKLKISIDVNGRLARNIEALKTKAIIMAEQARSFQKDVPLEPMSSYDRRIIHTALEGAPQVKTESLGMGKERRVVIRYVGV